MTRHGFPQPPSLVRGHGAHHSDAEVVDVIANGTGMMPAYGGRISPRDRWAIAAYVSTLAADDAAPPEEDGHEAHDHEH